MPFWKQSEDPWDKKDGVSKPPKEPKETLAGSLKQWNEERKAAAKEREEAKRLPPEPCPWCGKEMEQGFLLTGRDPVRWYPGTYKIAWFSRDRAGSFRVDTEGDFTGTYRVTWLCRDCRKLTFDMPDPEEEDDSFFAPSEPKETNKEEVSEE